MNIRLQPIYMIGVNKKIKFKNVVGFALIEMLVATALFAIIIMAAIGIFQTVIEAQRSALAGQNTQESMRFALEVIGKEIRMAKSDNTCATALGLSADDSPANRVFNTANGGLVLYFMNKDDDCVAYYMNSDRLIIRRDDGSDDLNFPITPDEVRISGLAFNITDDAAGNVQPKVTLKVKAEMITTKTMHQNPLFLQTSISSRVYE